MPMPMPMPMRIPISMPMPMSMPMPNANANAKLKQLTAARFKRQDYSQLRKVAEETKHPRSRASVPIAFKANNLPANISGEKSFASVVHGGEKRNFNYQIQGELRFVTMSDCDLIKVEDSTKVTLVNVREVGTINAVYRLC
ncbi:hypothetical protein Tco_1563379 [Tanacetum coccineum]